MNTKMTEVFVDVTYRLSIMVVETGRKTASPDARALSQVEGMSPDEIADAAYDVFFGVVESYESTPKDADV